MAGNIGGGIVNFSFAFYHLGLFPGLVLAVMFAICSHLANILFLKVKDLTPRKYESMYEIAYLLYGRASIFIVCINNLMNNFTLLIYSYIIIGDVGQTLMTQVLVGDPLNGHLAS